MVILEKVIKPRAKANPTEMPTARKLVQYRWLTLNSKGTDRWKWKILRIPPMFSYAEYEFMPFGRHRRLQPGIQSVKPDVECCSHHRITRDSLITLVK
jgi:hypothetical protein